MATLEVVRLKLDPRRESQLPDEFDVTNDDGADGFDLPEGEYEFGETRTVDMAESAQIKGERKRHEKLQMRIPLSFVFQSAARMEYKEALVKELFFFIPFFLMYLFLVVLDQSVEQSYFASWSLGARLYEQDIAPINDVVGPSFGKSIGEIAEPIDFYLWIQSTFVDLHYTRADPNERQILGPNYVGGPNIQFGAARLRVQRVLSDSCVLEARWLPTNESLFAQECFAPYTSSKLNTSAFGPPAEPEKYKFATGCVRGFIVGDMASYDCGGNHFDVSLNFSHTEAVTAMQSIQPDAATGFNGFFDPEEARLLTLSFFTYNPAFDHFGMTVVWLEHSATGMFIPGWRTTHFRLYSQVYFSRGMLTIAFAILVFIHFMGYISSLVTAYQKERLLDQILQVWSLLDIANIISFLVLFGFRFSWWDRSTKLNFKMTTNGVYDTDMESIAVLYDAQTFCLTVSTLLVFLRILKFNMLSSRLAVINRTLDSASQNLINLLVIFLIVLLSYAVMATALFGSGMRDYYSYENAIASLLRMLIGDFDYDGIKDEQWYLAALFFWSFTILALFMLLNMMIAVIGDAFDEEQQASTGAPIADEIVDFFRSVGRSIQRFALNPVGVVKDAAAYSSTEYARQGKYVTIMDELNAHRRSLPCEHVKPEQFLLLTEEEQDLVLPNPKVDRNDLTAIFCQTDLAKEKYEYLGERFLDDFWLDVVAEYRFFRDEHNIQLMMKRRARIKHASMKALRQVLGAAKAPEEREDEAEHAKSKRNHDAEAVEESIAFRPAKEVFGPTYEALTCLRQVQGKVAGIEDELVHLGTIVSQLDAVSITKKLGGAEAASPTQSTNRRRRSSAVAHVVEDAPVGNYKRFFRATNAPVPSVKSPE